jgi:hypothetical protein
MANVSGFQVSGLSEYVKENRDNILRKIILEGDTISKMAKQLGVKTKERLHYFALDPAIQDGKGCGFNPSGATNITERDIETAVFKVNDEWCNDDLLGKFAEYLVRYGADANAEKLAFEELIADELVKNINKQMETLVWQGSTNDGDLIDGLITQAYNDRDTIRVEYAGLGSAATLYEKVKAVIMAIPEEILDDAVVFLSVANFRSLVFELLEMNNFHITPEEIEKGEFYFPGTTVAIHKTIGLTGQDDFIYATTWANMVYATDMLDDKEELRFWFSDDADLHRVKVKWNAGVATYFPDYVVMGGLFN